MKKILKAILLGLIATICIVMLFMAGCALAHLVMEAGGGDGAIVLMILGVVWIVSSVAFYKTKE